MTARPPNTDDDRDDCSTTVEELSAQSSRPDVEEELLDSFVDTTLLFEGDILFFILILSYNDAKHWPLHPLPLKNLKVTCYAN